VGSVVELLNWHNILYLMAVNRRIPGSEVQLLGFGLAVGVSNSGSVNRFTFS
jgi:hypothetical protein